MLKKLTDRDFRYRVKRKVVKLLRARAHGVDVHWDRKCYHRLKTGKKAKEIIDDYKKYAFWSEVDDPCSFFKKTLVKNEGEALCQAAEKAVAHCFNLLGSGDRELGKDIDWHHDLSSGYRWDPSIHYSQIRWEDLPDGVEIKSPWELSRCMHFSALGLADWVSGDIKYYNSFKKDVLSWIESNPFERGVNWACPMDVALRAVNWLTAIQLFQPRIAEEDDEAFLDGLLESLWLHGRHLFRNLEWSGPLSRKGGNHFLSNLIGLLAVSSLFPFRKEAQKWWSFAKEHLEDQILRQVNPDGTNFEVSTSYHRLTLEMLLWADSLAKRANDEFSREYTHRLSRMIEFVEAYSPPSGVSPQFGDNDSGRVIWTGLGDHSDHRYLLSPLECIGAGGHRWLLRGPLEWPSFTKSNNKGFPDGGFYFLNIDDAYLAVRAGALSPTGGHSHCDQLSFVLSLNRHPIFVDRGTGVYTSNANLRNELRSTVSHNTPFVNGWEQSQFSREPRRVFGMSDDTQTQVIEFGQSGSLGNLVAEHHGFHRYRQGMVCRRSFKLISGELSIEDQISKLKAGDTIEWNFHLAPDVKVDLSDRGCRIDYGGGEILFTYPANGKMSLENVQHSPEYGILLEAQCLRYILTVGEKNVDHYEFQINY